VVGALAVSSVAGLVIDAVRDNGYDGIYHLALHPHLIQIPLGIAGVCYAIQGITRIWLDWRIALAVGLVSLAPATMLMSYMGERSLPDHRYYDSYSNEK